MAKKDKPDGVNDFFNGLSKKLVRTMKRLLVITSTFAPTAKPGVYRILKFVKYLPQFGWMPEVLWVDRKSVV